jgi:hypothetical protein
MFACRVHCESILYLLDYVWIYIVFVELRSAQPVCCLECLEP